MNIAACSSFSPEPATGDGGASSEAGPAAEGGSADGGSADGEADATALDGAVLDAGGPDAGGYIVFITSVGYADITTAASADAKCTAEAAGRLPDDKKFKAWFPNGNTAAPDRLFPGAAGKAKGPWFRVDGKRVASTAASFLTTGAVPLEAPIVVTAANKMVGDVPTWTGTLADGGVGTVCPQAPPTRGSAASRNGRWTDSDAGFTASCGTSFAVYCFQSN